jgi:ParB/RepB/Spo0J family partition protein
MPATAAKLEAHAVVELVPLDKITESPLNHRKRNWGDLEGLAESIRAQGVLQPVLLRPRKGIGSNLYELVFGARRLRGSKMAGLTTIPAMVRDMTDHQVIEAQILENLARQDVHPMDEAEGIDALLQPKGPYTVDDIAAKVGKSKAYVYARLKLLDLTTESREAYYEGKLSASTALYLARVTPELQKQALEALVPKWRRVEEEGPLPAREASEILQRGFMRVLKDAPFPVTDPDLVSAAGTCSSCPKRTGAQPQLFEDVGSADVCTDPTCYDSKRDAEWTKRAAAAEAAGKKVLSAKESAEVLGDYSVGGGYVALDQTCQEDPKYRTYAKLLGKRAAEAVVLARGRDGETRELVPKKEIGKLLKAAGHDFKAARAATSSLNKADHAKRKAERKLEQEVSRRRHAKVLAAIGAKEPGDDFWRLAAVAMEDTAQEIIREERGLEDHEEVSVTAHVATMKGKELRLFVLGLVVDPLLTGCPYGEIVKAQKALYAWAGVDEKAIRAEAKEAVKAKTAAAPAKGKGGELKWVSADDEHTAEPVDGLVYHVAPTPGGKTWVAKVSTTHGDSWKTLGTFTTLLSDAKKLCQADLLERAADGILKNAGAGELTKKDTKGAAARRRRG